MKQIETFFELSNYDSKNITNKGGEVINQTTLDKIESEGVTLEFLQGLNVPIFKYRTQITIHGMFPALSSNYIGRYKNLIQNKNLSIGVKWDAIDYSKKQKIYSTICNHWKGWSKKYNSQEFFIYKMSNCFHDKETYKNYLEAAKADISHIDKTLFFGNCGVYLSQSTYGGYFLVTYINIGGILEKNVIPCIENITRSTMAEIEAKAAKRKADYDAAEIIRKAKYDAEMAARKEKQIPLMDAARKVLDDAGYILHGETQIEQDKIFIKIRTDIDTGNFIFVAYKFTKEKGQKKWRFIKAESNDLNFEFKANWYDHNLASKETYSGYIKETVKAAKIETKQDIKPMAVNVIKGSVILVNYSDKAIALFGETKAIKDQIKAIGGRFNPYLNNNGKKEAGWILPLNKIEQAKQLIN